MDKVALETFLYRQSPDGRFFPIVPLKIKFKKNAADTSALVDSGAAISIFRPEVAEQLGIKIEDGKEIFLSGVGGRIKGYLHNLEVEVSGKNFCCPIIFSYEYTVSFSLLGREKFFKNFVIIFDEKEKMVKLE